MRSFLRFIVGILLNSLLLLFLVVTTLKFQLLNESFLLNAFEKHDVYSKMSLVIAAISQEEGLSQPGMVGADPSSIAQSIPPETTRQLVENGVRGALAYINGESLTISLYDSGGATQQFSPVGGGAGSGLSVPQLAGIGKHLFPLWVVLGVLVIVLVVGHYFLAAVGKRKGTGILLFFNGVYIVVISVGFWAYASGIGQAPTNTSEPSQLLLKIFAPVIASELIPLWIMYAVILMSVGGVLYALGSTDGQKK